MARQLKFVIASLVLLPLGMASATYDDTAFDKTNAFDESAFDFGGGGGGGGSSQKRQKSVTLPGVSMN